MIEHYIDHKYYNLYSNCRIVSSIITVIYDTNLAIKNFKYFVYFQPNTNNNNNYYGSTFS